MEQRLPVPPQMGEARGLHRTAGKNSGGGGGGGTRRVQGARRHPSQSPSGRVQVSRRARRQGVGEDQGRAELQTQRLRQREGQGSADHARARQPP